MAVGDALTGTLAAQSHPGHGYGETTEIRLTASLADPTGADPTTANAKYESAVVNGQTVTRSVVTVGSNVTGTLAVPTYTRLFGRHGAQHWHR